MKRYAFVDLRVKLPIIESDQLLTQDEVDVILEKFNYGLLTPNEYRVEPVHGGGYALILDRERMQNDSM